MANCTRNWDTFEDAMQREGYGIREIPYLPGAREAIEKDKQDDFNERRLAKSESWKNVDEKGNKLDYFRNPQELKAAMGDPLYKVSEPYRQAIQRMLRNTPEESIPTPSAEDTQGSGGLRGMTVEKMLASARKDAAVAQYKKLAVEASTDPIKRIELMTLLSSNDPAVQAWVHEGTEAVAPEGQYQREMRQMGRGTSGPDLNAAMAGNESDNESEGNR